MNHRLRYVIQQYKKHPQTILADILIFAYFALILVGQMSVHLAIISGIALAWYVGYVYKNITK